MTKKCCTVHGSFACFVFCIYIGSIFKQQFHNIYKPPYGRMMQCSGLVKITMLNICPSLNKKLSNLNVTVLSGIVHGGFAIPIINSFDIGTRSYMRLNCFYIITPTCRRPQRQLWSRMTRNHAKNGKNN